MTFQPAKYWESRLSERFDAGGVGDIGMSRSYNEYLYKIRRSTFRRVIARLGMTPSKCRVLDVGAGTGFYVREWKAWGAREVAGLDITATSVARLKESWPESAFDRADIGDRDLPELNGPFDIVSALDVMFHIVDDTRYVRALANIHDLLRPGALFIYSDNLVRRESRMPHYVSRQEQQILSALDSAGFDVLKRVPMFVLMNDPVRTHSRLLRRWFSLVYTLAHQGELHGRLTGAALYPAELIATRLVSRGPSTEILVCRRR